MLKFHAFGRLRGKLKGRSFAQLMIIAARRIRAQSRLTYYKLRYPRVKFGKHVNIQGRLRIYGRGHVEIGDRSAFTGYSRQPNLIVTLNSDARIVIGKYSSFNGAEIVSQSSIEFGEYCMIGDAVVSDTDHHSVEINRWDPAAQAATRPIRVEDNVWIAGRCLVLKGVTIGRNSVIGAATVVRKSVPPNSIAIGNPQQVVRMLDTSIQPYRFDN